MPAIHIHPTRALIAAAAVALVLGSFATWRVTAAPTAQESTFVAVTPTRILDTRDPADLGLPGPFVSPVAQQLRVTGEVATPAGGQVVMPDGATGVAMNVTVVTPTADGFVSIRPGDASGAPTTSSLNVAAGDIVPNAVTVELPTSGTTAGTIDITFDAYGADGPTADILIDVVGYTTNVGLQELVAELAAKADLDSVYTRTEVDAALAAVPEPGPIGGVQPTTFPTPQLSGPSGTFVTSRDSRLHLLVHAALGLVCDTSTSRFVWLELDGTPIESTLRAMGLGAQSQDPLTLSGVTPGVIGAGQHEIQVRQSCTFGNVTSANSVGDITGQFTYVADGIIGPPA
ncbi:MAG: hypothetical protein WD225_02515 [Ilumatobacteraceae bacterium]